MRIKNKIIRKSHFGASKNLNQKIAQTCISRDTDSAFLILIEMENMNNSKTWKAEGVRKISA